MAKWEQKALNNVGHAHELRGIGSAKKMRNSFLEIISAIQSGKYIGSSSTSISWMQEKSHANTRSAKKEKN